MELQEVKKVLGKDPIMRQLLEKVSIEIPMNEGDVYSNLIRSIVYQQISTKAANSIYERFLAFFDGYHPEPVDLVQRTVSDLRPLGLSKQKASYVINIADFFRSNRRELESWESLSDDEVINTLTSIKGVGVWTAQMVLMFTLGRPDVFPLGDHGIKTGIQKLYGGEVRTKNDFIALSENWRPYRTYASIAIWNSHNL